MALFITFEGIEGCGKSTQLHLLAERIRQRGGEVVCTREPGGCPIADQIRSILLDGANRTMAPTTELLLYAAARAQHVAEVVLPALREGKTVLCDRFTDATVAYQGFARGLDRRLIDDLNRLAAGSIRPSLTVLLDCPEEIGLARALARIDGTSGPREERFELESRQFHERVRNGYLELAITEPERYVVVDGSGEVATVAQAVATAVMPRLGMDEEPGRR